MKGSDLFEKNVNVAAHQGLLEKSLGIPKGSTPLNFKWGSNNGIDGAFLTKDGRFFILESKNYSNTGGTLGKIWRSVVGGRSDVTLRQASPEWIQKCMHNVLRNEPEMYTTIMESVQGTSLSKIMAGVKKIDELALMDEAGKFAKLAPLFPGTVVDTDSADKLAERLEYFLDPGDVKTFWAAEFSDDADFLKDVGRFFGSDLRVGCLNRTGLKPGHYDDVVESIGKWSDEFGKADEVVKASERFLYKGLKFVSRIF